MVHGHEFVPGGGSPSAFLRAGAHHASGEEQGKTYDDVTDNSMHVSAWASAEEQGRTEMNLLEVCMCVLVCVSVSMCVCVCGRAQRSKEELKKELK
jgi:hypothetical protein